MKQQKDNRLASISPKTVVRGFTIQFLLLDGCGQVARVTNMGTWYCHFNAFVFWPTRNQLDNMMFNYLVHSHYSFCYFVLVLIKY